jgi:hypothetical protein
MSTTGWKLFLVVFAGAVAANLATAYAINNYYSLHNFR